MSGDIDTIIERAGGAEQVARLTGVGAEAIRKWRQSGAIPAKHWTTLLRQPGITLADLDPGHTLTEATDAPPPGATAALLLADGRIFWGRGFGAHTDASVGELCFSTGLTGYQETLTDPSFAGQIITFTFPHIGNVGTNADDLEADRIAALGAVVRCDPTDEANWRATASLNTWLIAQGKPGIAGIDTRAITRIISDGGPQTALIAYPKDGRFDLDALRAAIKAWPGLEGMDLSKAVTCAQTYTWDQGVWERAPATRAKRHRVVAVDYGAKRNILRCLVSAGCDVTVVRADATAEDILKHNPDGVFLSNGPGDPAATGTYAVPAIRGVLEAGKPVFGICLGHQLLALALGAKTYKLDQGHRGANQPVKDLTTGKVEITSQNHGFAVEDQSLPDDVSITHKSLFDGSNEGIASSRYAAFSVQYHPEASPGPSDSFHLFERFVALMDEKA